MKSIKELKVKYDKQPITAIEKEAKSTQGRAKDVYSNFIEILFYLERTQRFKENSLYKKSTFNGYISFEYGLLYNTYQLYSSILPGMIKSEVGFLWDEANIKKGH